MYRWVIEFQCIVNEVIPGTKSMKMNVIDIVGFVIVRGICTIILDSWISVVRVDRRFSYRASPMFMLLLLLVKDKNVSVTHSSVSIRVSRLLSLLVGRKIV